MKRRKANLLKYRAKKWLEKQGFCVEYLEKQFAIKKNGGFVFVKKDIFGADLIAINKKQIVFANVVGRKEEINNHMEKFCKYPFPPFVDLWIIVGEKRKAFYIQKITCGGKKYERQNN